MEFRFFPLPIPSVSRCQSYQFQGRGEGRSNSGFFPSLSVSRYKSYQFQARRDGEMKFRVFFLFQSHQFLGANLTSFKVEEKEDRIQVSSLQFLPVSRKV
jgi:hypothetical protein